MLALTSHEKKGWEIVEVFTQLRSGKGLAELPWNCNTF